MSVVAILRQLSLGKSRRPMAFIDMSRSTQSIANRRDQRSMAAKVRVAVPNALSTAHRLGVALR